MAKLKILVFVLILVFYGLLLAHNINFVPDDLSRHLKNGEMIFENRDVLTTNFYSFTEPDFPFINDHWLSGVVFLFFYKISGFSGLVIFKTVLLLFTFSLLFLVTAKKADFWLAAAFSLPAILILRERAEIRPEIFSYLFTAVFLYLLLDLEKHPEHKRIFWLIPLQLFWVNLHTFFIIGIMIVGGFLLEKIIRQLADYKNILNNPQIKKLFLIFVAMVLVCLINPNGISGALNPFFRFKDYAIDVLPERPMSSVLDIKPVEDISVLIFIPLVFLSLFSFVFGFRQKQKPIFYSLAIIGVAAAGFSRVRLLPFFSLIFLPAVSANFNGIFVRSKEWLKQKSPKTKNVLGKTLILALIVAILCLIFFRIQGKISKDDKLGVGLASRSNDAAMFFKEQGLHGPIFNDHAIGQYLIWHLFPQEKVFFDQRGADAYSAHFINDVYRPMLTSEEKWQEMTEIYHFNVIFFCQYDEVFNSREFLKRRINDDPDWSLVYADNNNVILLRNNPENQEKIKQFQITRENVFEKLSYLFESSDLDGQIAIADIFNLIGREDLALSVFKKVAAKRPKDGRLWLIMGETEITQNNIKNDFLAVMDLERAISLGQKNEEAYTNLGLVYFRLGRFEDAKNTLQKALSLDPGRYDALNYLNQLQPYLTP